MDSSFDPIFDQAAKQYNIDPSLLKAVAMTESGGDPSAMSRDDNGKPLAHGLMQLTGPTYKALGVTNPYLPEEAIPAAASLLRQNLDASGGDTKTALAMYHGGTNTSNWGPKTQAYPDKVLNNQAKATQTQLASSDPVYQFLNSGGVTPGAQTNQAAPGTPAASGDPVYDFLSSGGNISSARGVTPFRVEIRGVGNSGQSPQPETPFSNVLHGAASLADTVLNLPSQAAEGATYAVNRAMGNTPETSQTNAKTAFGWAENPVGKAFGVTDTPGYQNEASKQFMSFVGQNLDKGSDWISQQTGLPKADVDNMIQTLTYAAPGAIKGAADVVKSAPAALSGAASQLADAFAKKTAPMPIEARIDPTMPKPRLKLATDGSVAPVENAATQLQAQFANAGGKVEPTVETPQARTMTGMGAATANSNPYPVFTGEQAARGNETFPQVKPSKISADVPLPEQQARADIANEILGPDHGQVRTGVVTGNENTLRSEYTEAKNPKQTPAQAALNSQIATEQNALTSYAKDRVDATGANPTLTNDYQRGQTVNDAFFGKDGSLDSYFKDVKGQIYQKAREVAGDNPIPSSHVDNLLADPQFNAATQLSGHEGVVSGAQKLIDLAKTTGFKDPVTGEFLQPGSVAAWDAVRKSINQRWTPDTAITIRDINGAIDRDIAAAGGQELYKLGDKVHQAQKTIMGSNGISKVFGHEDANGVQTGTPYEKIPAKLNNLPLDQWRHIHNTLDELSRGQLRGAPEGMPPVPEGLKNAALAAKNEIAGSLAREVYQTGAGKVGVWDQNGVNKTLNSLVGQKILEAMPPNEVRSFHTLNYGGQIMPGVQAYEGAGLQSARVNAPGFFEKYAPAAGAFIGAKGGPFFS